MDIINGIVVYVILWWVVFFVTLPIGVRTGDESDEEIVPGSVSSAPVNPQIGKKMAITTFAAALLWSVYYVVERYELISLRPEGLSGGP